MWEKYLARNFNHEPMRLERRHKRLAVAATQNQQLAEQSYLSAAAVKQWYVRCETQILTLA